MGVCMCRCLYVFVRVMCELNLVSLSGLVSVLYLALTCLVNGTLNAELFSHCPGPLQCL